MSGLFRGVGRGIEARRNNIYSGVSGTPAPLCQRVSNKSNSAIYPETDSDDDDIKKAKELSLKEARDRDIANKDETSVYDYRDAVDFHCTGTTPSLDIGHQLDCEAGPKSAWQADPVLFRVSDDEDDGRNEKPGATKLRGRFFTSSKSTTARGRRKATCVTSTSGVGRKPICKDVEVIPSNRSKEKSSNDQIAGGDVDNAKVPRSQAGARSKKMDADGGGGTLGKLTPSESGETGVKTRSASTCGPAKNTRSGKGTASSTNATTNELPQTRFNPFTGQREPIPARKPLASIPKPSMERHFRILTPHDFDVDYEGRPLTTPYSKACAYAKYWEEQNRKIHEENKKRAANHQPTYVVYHEGETLGSKGHAVNEGYLCEWFDKCFGGSFTEEQKEWIKEHRKYKKESEDEVGGE